VTRLGLISDTHGLVRREALRALASSDLIVHAGDVGAPNVLAALRRIAPVVAVRGNNDRATWARRLPRARTLTVGAVRMHIVHDVTDLAVDLARAHIRLVVSGHSHRPSIREENGILFVNPGSAGPRRFTLPVSVARCAVRAHHLRARLIQLPIRRAGR
jgi:putative phosphoesterase